MNSARNIILIFLVLLLYSCADYKTSKINQKDEKKYFSSKGFALIYEDHLYKQKVVNKKYNDDNLKIMHSILKTNTPIKIINPINSKTIETSVYKRANYPKIFNVVISKKMASILELDINNPYVEILEVKKNKTFVAKESSMFEEEKNVAEKAPVNKIEMDVLTKNEIKPDKKKEKKVNFILVISDFYYAESANSLMQTLQSDAKINNMSIKKINDKKYRLFAGPFKNFNALKTVYISLNNLGFENLDIYSE